MRSMLAFSVSKCVETASRHALLASRSREVGSIWAADVSIHLTPSGLTVDKLKKEIAE